MNSVLVYSSKAKEEFKEAVKWYAEKEYEVGAELEKLVSEKIETIRNYPERYPVRKGVYRETPVRKFPYLIIYRFNKAKHLITIVSIHNTKRNPKRKYRK